MSTQRPLFAHPSLDELLTICGPLRPGVAAAAAVELQDADTLAGELLALTIRAKALLSRARGYADEARDLRFIKDAERTLRKYGLTNDKGDSKDEPGQQQ